MKLCHKYDILNLNEAYFSSAYKKEFQMFVIPSGGRRIYWRAPTNIFSNCNHWVYLYEFESQDVNLFLRKSLHVLR